MKRNLWEIRVGFLLVVISITLYSIHYSIFKDIHHILFWSMTNLAFLPISVLFVTLIINRLMIRREKKVLLSKLNMLIGTFFSEVGIKALEYFSYCDSNVDKIRENLEIKNDWTKKDFSKIKKFLNGYDYTLNIKGSDLENLRFFLMEKRDFLVRLLENSNLLEHEAFTDALRTVFHLTEELTARSDLQKLPASDIKHISGDIKRTYKLMVLEWIDYMKYLKYNYSYLFSFSIRTNPFNKDCSVVVE